MSKIVEVSINFEQTVTFFTEISDDGTATELEDNLHEMEVKFDQLEKRGTPYISIVVDDIPKNKKVTSEDCINIHEYFK